MFFLGNSGLILSILLAAIAPFVFVFPFKKQFSQSENFHNQAFVINSIVAITEKATENIVKLNQEIAAACSDISANLTFSVYSHIIHYCTIHLVPPNKTFCLDESGNKAPPSIP